MPEQIDWDAPPLSPYDQRLIEAYMAVGRPLDDLPYSDAFDQLMERMGIDDTRENRHAIFKRLLALRKMGRLPRSTYAA